MNFAPEPKSLFVVAVDENEQGDVIRRREYMVLGWTARDGRFVPVVADETSALPHALEPHDLERAFFVASPIATYTATADEEPLWAFDRSGGDRSGFAS